MTLHAFTLIIAAGIIHNALVWLPVGWWVGKDVVPQWGMTEWAFVSASALLHIFYFVTLLRGYRVADLTVVYPLARGSGPLISSMVAVLFLGEHLSSLGAVGIAAVVAGVFLIAGGPAMLRAATRPGPGEARDRTIKGLYYGLLTGLFIAAYTVVDSYAVKVMLLSPILLDYMGNLVRVVMLAPLGMMNWAETRRLWLQQWRFALVVAIFSPMAYVLVLYAVQTAPISHVAPAREVSMLFAALIGGKLLGEGDRLLRIAGALLIGVGVVALGLG